MKGNERINIYIYAFCMNCVIKKNVDTTLLYSFIHSQQDYTIFHLEFYLFLTHRYILFMSKII